MTRDHPRQTRDVHPISGSNAWESSPKLPRTVKARAEEPSVNETVMVETASWEKMPSKRLPAALAGRIRQAHEPAIRASWTSPEGSRASEMPMRAVQTAVESTDRALYNRLEMRPEHGDPRASGTDPDPIRIGVSSCLLGEEVRFDGGHKRDQYVTGILGRYVQWVPVCPELEMGLGVAREALRLVGDPNAPRLVTVKTNVDHTEGMLAWSRARVEALRGMSLDGYILKSKSPSCGMERVRVYTEAGMPSRSGPGLFARVLMEAMPLLVVEEEGRLNDPRLRETFIVRVFSHHRWRQLARTRLRPADLVAFHARHKFLLMAHSEPHLRALGRLVARARGERPEELARRYAEGFFAALQVKATRRTHTNVLQHIAGYFRERLDRRDREELHATIADYRAGLVPLVVPLTLLKHHIGRLELAYLRDQIYLEPHPRELMLLNHV